jgi:hypothetical protein
VPGWAGQFDLLGDVIDALDHLAIFSPRPVIGL